MLSAITTGTPSENTRRATNRSPAPIRSRAERTSRTVSTSDERVVDRLLHPLGERVHGALEAREVDEHELPVGAVRDAEDPASRRVRDGGGDRDLLPGRARSRASTCRRSAGRRRRRARSSPARRDVLAWSGSRDVTAPVHRIRAAPRLDARPRDARASARLGSLAPSDAVLARDMPTGPWPCPFRTPTPWATDLLPASRAYRRNRHESAPDQCRNAPNRPTGRRAARGADLTARTAPGGARPASSPRPARRSGRRPARRPSRRATGGTRRTATP